jgi:eukaryotic-like serine/threonine-protein kinase
VAYFVLTGRPPFQGATAADTLAAHVLDPVVPLRSVRPDVPEDLERVVLRCLEKDPDDRFLDAGELDRAFAECRC